MAARTSHPFPPPDTLVAILKEPRDLTIARTQHWYRIPCQKAPTMIETARWLAFYHTAAFGATKWAVHHVAPIERLDRVRRRDLLPDEPDHPRAADPYLRVAIGELKRLDRPVPSARWHRIVFIPTTLAKLHAAREINDLYHESPLEDRLWQALCDRQMPAERQFYVNERQTSYYLDFAIFCARGDVDVECDGDTWHLRPGAVVEDNARNNFLTRLGWSVLRFSSRELSEETVSSSVDLVRDTAERLGGIELPNNANRRFARSGAIVEQLRLW